MIFVVIILSISHSIYVIRDDYNDSICNYAVDMIVANDFFCYSRVSITNPNTMTPYND